MELHPKFNYKDTKDARYQRKHAERKICFRIEVVVSLFMTASLGSVKMTL